MNEPYAEIGGHAQIDADVTLGYRYPGDSQPTRIGDHAIIRSGSIIYANTTIGNRFQCGSFRRVWTQSGGHGFGFGHDCDYHSLIFKISNFDVKTFKDLKDIEVPQ